MASFIVFEGGDGSGKSTQSRALYRRLRRRSYPVLLIREPGGTPTGESIRRWLKTRGNLNPVSELSLFVAARAQLVDNVIRPALRDGATVICDRYTASTIAYQGYGRQLDLELIRLMNRAATAGLSPVLTVLLDLPVRSALARRETQDAIESAPMDFHERVREGYLTQAAADPDGWLVLDASRPSRDLGREIWAKVQPLL